MAVSYNVTIDQGADWYITFIYNQPAEITNITANGTTITVNAVNGFYPGQIASISGVNPSQYNLQNFTVVSSTNSEFTISSPVTGTYISGGLAYAPVNLSGYTAKMQLRSLPSDVDAALSLETGDGITITPLTGQIDVHATSAQTTTIDEGTYYYDIEITSSSGVVTRIAQGQAIVSAEVTRV